jgi:hypothetical protein
MASDARPYALANNSKDSVHFFEILRRMHYSILMDCPKVMTLLFWGLVNIQKTKTQQIVLTMSVLAKTTNRLSERSRKRQIKKTMNQSLILIVR